MNAAAIVLHRDCTPNVVTSIKSMGGGWRTGIEFWLGYPEMEYLLLVAPSRERMSKRAPLAYLARDLDALRLATLKGCALLDDVTCAWLILREGKARDVVQQIILADSVPKGRA